MTEVKEKVPVMYMGWTIRSKATGATTRMYWAINYATGDELAPLYKKWKQLKSVIDAMKK